MEKATRTIRLTCGLLRGEHTSLSEQRVQRGPKEGSLTFAAVSDYLLGGDGLYGTEHSRRTTGPTAPERLKFRRNSLPARKLS